MIIMIVLPLPTASNWLVIAYSHIPVFSMLYIYLIRQWRIIGVYIIYILHSVGES